MYEIAETRGLMRVTGFVTQRIAEGWRVMEEDGEIGCDGWMDRCVTGVDGYLTSGTIALIGNPGARWLPPTAAFEAQVQVQVRVGFGPGGPLLGRRGNCQHQTADPTLGQVRLGNRVAQVHVGNHLARGEPHVLEIRVSLFHLSEQSRQIDSDPLF